MNKEYGLHAKTEVNGVVCNICGHHGKPHPSYVNCYMGRCSYVHGQDNGIPYAGHLLKFPGRV